jgi:hypothetical protein
MDSSIKPAVLSFLNSNPGEHKTEEVAKAIGADINTTILALLQLEQEGFAESRILAEAN